MVASLIQSIKDCDYHRFRQALEHISTETLNRRHAIGNSKNADTALFHAVKSSCYLSHQDYVHHASSLPDYPKRESFNNDSSYFLAVRNYESGYVPFVRELLLKGADPNIGDRKTHRFVIRYLYKYKSHGTYRLFERERIYNSLIEFGIDQGYAMIKEAGHLWGLSGVCHWMDGVVSFTSQPRIRAIHQFCVYGEELCRTMATCDIDKRVALFLSPVVMERINELFNGIREMGMNTEDAETIFRRIKKGRFHIILARKKTRHFTSLCFYEPPNNGNLGFFIYCNRQRGISGGGLLVFSYERMRLVQKVVSTLVTEKNVYEKDNDLLGFLQSHLNAKVCFRLPSKPLKNGICTIGNLKPQLKGAIFLLAREHVNEEVRKHPELYMNLVYRHIKVCMRAYCCTRVARAVMGAKLRDEIAQKIKSKLLEKQSLHPDVKELHNAYMLLFA